MKVKELAKWLSEFEDQDATVEVVSHKSGTGYYDQGGSAQTVKFELYLATYTDMRGNPFVKEDAPYYNSRTLLLGEVNA